MPTVNVPRDKLFEALGQIYTEDEFTDLCFSFGIEFDGVTSEKEMVANEQGEDAAQGLSEEAIYKIEIPANRYDLLCLEGIARALRIFLGKDKTPEFKLQTPSKPLQMTVTKDTANIRPFVVCAVLRNIKFDQTNYQSFIELQEKLHQNICRRRTLVAVGTHDLDTLKPPFTYEALPPKQIKFVPLNESRAFTADDLFTYYKEEKKQNNLKQYLHIIEDSPVYPVIYDANRVVLSLPPIINGEHSKITLNTKNVFIECTATDYTKANIVLNTVVAMFSQYCKEAFTIETVNISYETTGKSYLLPDMKSNVFETDVNYINSGIGINLKPTEMAQMLSRMQLPATYIPERNILKVLAPPTRSDILHACDIQEDVAIAYGYNNVKETIPKSATVGKEFPLNKLSDQLRRGVAEAGYLEVLTWALCSQKENFDNLCRIDDNRTAVKIANPVTIDFDIVRTSLLPGLLKTLAASKGQVHLPIKIFELSDVVLLDSNKDVGARNERRLAACYCGTTSGFEKIHGLMDRIMELNGAVFHTDDEKKQSKLIYSIEKSDDPTFFEGRRADVLLNGKKIGVFGIFHPQVLKNFEIPHPVSALELNVEYFL